MSYRFRSSDIMDSYSEDEVGLLGGELHSKSEPESSSEPSDPSGPSGPSDSSDSSKKLGCAVWLLVTMSFSYSDVGEVWGRSDRVRCGRKSTALRVWGTFSRITR